MNHKKRSKLKTAALILLALIVVVCGAFYIYTLDYYRADDSVWEKMAIDESIVQGSDMIVLYPEEDNASDIGLIFYPGGKVETEAYVPLLDQLAEQGITCVLVDMPLHLAVFDINAADDIYEQFPEITSWYLCGHSLGGAMASSYVEDNTDKLDGLILLGAYPINDAPIATIAIYGTEDIKLDLEKLEGVDQVVIEGGNHAYFGNYGEQDGDGTASITREEQQAQTVQAIVQFSKASQ